jgi:predicted DNA-binding WGR domain protein
VENWRRFERVHDGACEFWQIRQEGIRCHINWGRDGSRRGGSTTVALLDERHAKSHVQKKIRGQLRKGFLEVAGLPAPIGDPDALVVETIADAQAKPAYGLPRPQYRPVEGFRDVVCHTRIHPESPGRGFYHYLVLRDEGRSALAFNVRESSHRPEAVTGFLETVVTVRDLPFDGRPHHKIALARPVGPFSHALLCSPALGQAAVAYPTIAARVATAFPIYDCEIGDADAEVFVDARIRGHGALPYSDWARRPHPVVDLRFAIQGPDPERDRTFKVYQRVRLDTLMPKLAAASPDSWLEVRSFRGEIRRLTPTNLAAPSDLDRFLLGSQPAI